MNTKIWLSPPHMGGNEQKYIQSAFETNWIAPQGPNLDNFEKKLAGFLQIPHVVALSSGTAAIHLSLIILGVQPGDEVLVSSFTFSATVNPIVYLGATPVLIDSEPDSWNMSPELLEEAITDRLKSSKKPKAILVVDLYGMPANMEKISFLSRKYQIPLLEDAAEAMGSRFREKSCGTFGLMGILSFNGNKIITTSGGGALVSENPDYISEARFYSTQARDKALHYEHSRIGYNYRMSNILAGIGCGQMEVLDQRIAKRRWINSVYRELLSDIPEIRFLTEPDQNYFSNHWLTTFFIDTPDNSFNRDTIRLALEKNNIESRHPWKPMHLQPVFRNAPAYTNGVSENIFQHGLCLPSGSALEMQDLQRIAGIIKSLRK